jgi:Flp pilus assembly protein TadG
MNILNGLPRRDSGSVALEAAVLTPALLMLGLLIVAGGRVAVAHERIEAAASSAARAASLTRTASNATAAAKAEAAAALSSDHITCKNLTVSVNGDFTAPLGTPANVRVQLACTATLADLALPGLPGAKTVSATATSPLDSWRGRP